MPKPSILIVANYHPDKGGISGVVNNHFQKLADEGHKISIFNTNRSPLKRLLIIFSLIRAARNYDVIHIHGCSWLGFFPIVVGVAAGKIVADRKVIVTYHGGGAEHFLKAHKCWVRWVLNRSDAVTVMSSFLEKTFRKYGIETQIVRNLINLNVRAMNDKDFAYPRLVSIRSLSENYNICDILEAYKEVKRLFPRATLTIAGTGPELNKLQKQALFLRDVRFIGSVSNTVIPDLLEESNIFISVPSFDNQPMSIIEAFCCSTLVISSNVGGVVDMIDDGLSGLLVSVSQPSQIVDKIQWIMTHPFEASLIVQRGRESAQLYMWDSIKPLLYKLYGFES